MDFNTQLLRAVKTGNVVLGPVMTERCLREGTARMIVVASNCPATIKSKITRNKNQLVHSFDGSGMALGNVCRKPFSVSTLAIINPGESDILSVMRI